jgi:hypothetical protein
MDATIQEQFTMFNECAQKIRQLSAEKRKLCGEQRVRETKLISYLNENKTEAVQFQDHVYAVNERAIKSSFDVKCATEQLVTQGVARTSVREAFDAALKKSAAPFFKLSVTAAK